MTGRQSLHKCLCPPNSGRVPDVCQASSSASCVHTKRDAVLCTAVVCMVHNQESSGLVPVLYRRMDISAHLPSTECIPRCCVSPARMVVCQCVNAIGQATPGCKPKAFRPRTQVCNVRKMQASKNGQRRTHSNWCNRAITIIAHNKTLISSYLDI